MEEKVINLDGKIFKYNLIRKRIKNVYMRFNESGILVISAPKSMLQDTIDSFIKEKANWIIKQQNKIRMQETERETAIFKTGESLYFLGRKYILQILENTENSVQILDKADGLKNKEDIIIIKVKAKYINDSEYIKKFYDNWLKTECLKLSEEYIDIYVEKMKKYKIPRPKIVIKKFKAKWGCCIPKKKIVEFSMNLIKTPVECLEYVIVHELAHFKYIHHNQNFYNFVSIFIPNWKERRDLLNKKYGVIIN